MVRSIFGLLEWEGIDKKRRLKEFMNSCGNGLLKLETLFPHSVSYGSLKGTTPKEQ